MPDAGGRLIAVVGPTASGKTARAVALAAALDGEIISADSRQVYRGMELGTGKDLDEYGSVPYHLIDVRPAGHRYTLYEYLADAHAALADIRLRGRRPIVCGGTGLYVESLLNGLRLPEVPANPTLRASLSGKSLAQLADLLASMKALHNVTDIDTPQRAIRAIEIQTFYLEHPEAAADTRPHPMRDTLLIGIDIGRDQRRRRIARRLDARLEAGMADEVRGLLARGVPADTLLYYGLEYKYLTQYVTGQTTFDEMREGLLTAIRQFAKRQMTWWRGMERRGWHIHWLPYDMPQAEFVESVKSLL